MSYRYFYIKMSAITNNGRHYDCDVIHSVRKRLQVHLSRRRQPLAHHWLIPPHSDYGITANYDQVRRLRGPSSIVFPTTGSTVFNLIVLTPAIFICESVVTIFIGNFQGFNGASNSYFSFKLAN